MKALQPFHLVQGLSGQSENSTFCSHCCRPFQGIPVCWSFMWNNADFCWPAEGNAWAAFTGDAVESPVHRFFTNRTATKILWHPVMSGLWRCDTLLFSWGVSTVYMCSTAISPTSGYCIYPVFSLSERIPYYWMFAYCVCESQRHLCLFVRLT